MANQADLTAAQGMADVTVLFLVHFLVVFLKYEEVTKKELV